jgi:hypothetical protein
MGEGNLRRWISGNRADGAALNPSGLSQDFFKTTPKRANNSFIPMAFEI